MQLDQILQIDPNDLETLPDELRERFPEVVNDLRDGAIDEIPDAVLEQLPVSVVDRIPEGLLANSVNMTFVIILAIVAGIADRWRSQTALARSNFSRVRALHFVPLTRSSLALPVSLC